MNEIHYVCRYVYCESIFIHKKRKVENNLRKKNQSKNYIYYTGRLRKNMEYEF